MEYFFSKQNLTRNPMYSVSKSEVSLWKKLRSWNSSCSKHFNTRKYENNSPETNAFQYCTIASLWMKNNLVCVSKWSRGIETRGALSQVFYACWLSHKGYIHCKMEDGDCKPSQHGVKSPIYWKCWPSAYMCLLNVKVLSTMCHCLHIYFPILKISLWSSNIYILEMKQAKWLLWALFKFTKAH